ncbi:MAG: branched-chain-amino-acid transaminase [Planctomycetota bacterium]
MLKAADLPAKERPVVWIDGQFLPKSKATVSVFDHGFLYGDGVFEGIRIYNGKIFKARSHTERIFRNARAIFMDQQSVSPDDTATGVRKPEGGNFPYTEDEIIEIMEACVEANALSEGYIRLIFSRGVGTLGLHPFHCPRPSITVIADTISLYPQEMYEQGMDVITASRPRIPTVCLDPKLKPLNYLNNILAKVEAIDAGVLEAIMFRYTDREDSPRYIGECTGDNIFLIKNGKILTPALDTGMLDGITRSFVINELAPACGIEVEEKWLTIEDVLAADELFLTGTAAEIIAVRKVDDTTITNGEGPVTKKLREKFRSIVTSDAVPVD